MPQHTPEEQARAAAGLPPAAGAQQMVAGQAAPSGVAEMQGQPADPAQMLQQSVMGLAQQVGPAQAGQLLMQLGQELMQQGGGGMPGGAPAPGGGVPGGPAF